MVGNRKIIKVPKKRIKKSHVEPFTRRDWRTGKMQQVKGFDRGPYTRSAHNRRTREKKVPSRKEKKINSIDPYIKRIEITRLEGGRDEDYTTHTFTNFKDANRHLSMMALTAPDEASDKTDFKIFLRDGGEYHGRFDLERRHFMDSSNLLENHIRPQLLAHAEIQPPSHFTEKQRNQFKRTNEPHLQKSANGLLKSFGWHPNQ